MYKATSILVRRYILSLEKREMFFRKDILKFGNELAIDQLLHRLLQSREIVRIIRGVYMRRQADGWMPSHEDVSLAKAKLLEREISESSSSIAAKICTDPILKEMETKEQSNDFSDTLSFQTTGRSLSFKYQGKTIHFKETSGKKIKLNDSRLGKAINVLWYLGPELSPRDAEWFINKYLHRAERQRLRQILPALPTWLMTRLISILPSYLPFGYRAYNAEMFEKEDSQYEIRGEGLSLTDFEFH